MVYWSFGCSLRNFKFLILLLTIHTMIYNDVRMCLLFSRKRDLHFAWITGFLWNACHVQHLSLFSDINNCDYACPCMASLKEETQWLKNEVGSSFLFSHENMTSDIYTDVRVQIVNFPPFISLFQISTTVNLILAKTVRRVGTQE